MNSLFFHKIFSIFGKMSFLRLGIRYRIILPLKYQDIPFTVPFFGYKYNGNLNEYIDRFVFYFGAYEKEELLFIKKYLNRDSNVLDIGANTGHHSLFFSRYSREVYSFEPFQKMFRILEKRISDNGIKNIKALNFGLGSETGFLDFYAPLGPNSGVGSFSSADHRKNIGKLEIKKGDDVVSDLNIDSLGFIKIDVEGMEVSVLKGLHSTIHKYKPVMFIEMSPESQAILNNELKTILGGYKFHIIEANNPFLFFFNKPTCVLKDFTPQNETQNILCIPFN